MWDYFLTDLARSSWANTCSFEWERYTADGELVRRSSVPLVEANVKDFAHDDIVIIGSSVDLIPSKSDRDPVPSESKMNDTDPSGSELLDRGLRHKFLSRWYVMKRLSQKTL